MPPCAAGWAAAPVAAGALEETASPRSDCLDQLKRGANDMAMVEKKSATMAIESRRSREKGLA